MKRFGAVFACVCVLFFMGANAEWQTDLNKDFKFSCPLNKTLQKIESNQDNIVDDTLFNFRCVDMLRGSDLSDCEWSDYMEDYKQISAYQCYENGVLIGVESAIYGRDRKYRFKCCTVKDFVKDIFLNDDGTVTAEGDMRLTQPQFQEMYGEQFVAPSLISKRGLAVRAEKRRWPNGIIPYEFQKGQFDASEVALMKQAMKRWEQHTCLQFRPARPGDKNLIQFTNNSLFYGCYSNLGMVGGRQPVNLFFLCQEMSMVLHELGHAIGLAHEHQRPDRDNYITIDLTKVRPHAVSQFIKYSSKGVNTYRTPYDYSSVMHYKSTAFSKDRRSKTILTKDKSRQKEIRTAPDWLSYTDVKIVNLMYKCNKHCPANHYCKPPGYLNKYCQCICPKGICGLVVTTTPATSTTTTSTPETQPPTTTTTTSDCENVWSDSRQCDRWAARGECVNHPTWMRVNCQKSCNTCPGILKVTTTPATSTATTSAPETPRPTTTTTSDCENVWSDSRQCDRWAARGECVNNPTWMKVNCQKSCFKRCF